jgi:hypothetical protein
MGGVCAVVPCILAFRNTRNVEIGFIGTTSIDFIFINFINALVTAPREGKYQDFTSTLEADLARE